MLLEAKHGGSTSGSSPALDPKTGPNTPLGEDPQELGSMHHQAEPHIARSIFDPNFLVATFQEGRFFDGGALSCGYSVSRDEGLYLESCPHTLPYLADRRRL